MFAESLLLVTIRLFLRCAISDPAGAAIVSEIWKDKGTPEILLTVIERGKRLGVWRQNICSNSMASRVVTEEYIYLVYVMQMS